MNEWVNEHMKKERKNDINEWMKKEKLIERMGKKMKWKWKTKNERNTDEVKRKERNSFFLSFLQKETENERNW